MDSINSIGANKEILKIGESQETTDNKTQQEQIDCVFEEDKKSKRTFTNNGGVSLSNNGIIYFTKGETDYSLSDNAGIKLAMDYSKEISNRAENINKTIDAEVYFNDINNNKLSLKAGIDAETNKVGKDKTKEMSFHAEEINNHYYNTDKGNFNVFSDIGVKIPLNSEKSAVPLYGVGVNYENAFDNVSYTAGAKIAGEGNIFNPSAKVSFKRTINQDENGSLNLIGGAEYEGKYSQNNNSSELSANLGIDINSNKDNSVYVKYEHSFLNDNKEQKHNNSITLGMKINK